MNGQTAQQYDVSKDPEMMRYWVKEGPKTAAFLLVIPGCTVMGYGAGMALQNPIPYAIVGFGAGLLVWGLVVVLRKT